MYPITDFIVESGRKILKIDVKWNKSIPWESPPLVRIAMDCP